MSHQDQAATEEMLGTHKFTLWGLSPREIIAVVALIFVSGGAYYTVTTDLAEVKSKLTVTPAEVKSEVASIKQQVEAGLHKLEQKIETTRVERNEELRDLRKRISEGEQERAKIGQQVQNLDTLMRDIRDELRVRNTTLDRTEK